MHFLFALPGLHRVGRGAEIVFEAVAQQIALSGEHRVTVVGSGYPMADRAYDFVHVPAVSRVHFENWPSVPFLRTEFMYEELTFATGLATLRAVGDADVTMTCGYPYTNWALRRPRLMSRRPAHVFVTQNGDWPVNGKALEPRLFGCDGLICTNPIYYERNCQNWNTILIPNGVDASRFSPGPQRKAEMGLPTDRPVILMVSALEEGKRVIEAMHAVAEIPDAFLLIAGDGPLRNQVDRLAAEKLPGRFKRATFKQQEMPDLYRSADLFLHTKIIESFGNVYIEALSCGIPMVVHDDQVTRWILGDFAKLIDSTSHEILTSAIAEALRRPHSGESAAAWARSRYSWEVVAEEYSNFLSSVGSQLVR
jgi:glycosyltransferase involved in cell wall biosynthesis